jgi:hypothetical protein
MENNKDTISSVSQERVKNERRIALRYQGLNAIVWQTQRK